MYVPSAFILTVPTPGMLIVLPAEAVVPFTVKLTTAIGPSGSETGKFPVNGVSSGVVLLSSLATGSPSTVVVTVELSLVLLLSVTPLGGATLTLLVKVPVAFAATVPVIVKVTLCPLAKVTPVQAPVAEL